MNFRRSLKRINKRHYLIEVNATNREEAEKFTGKQAIWKSVTGKEIKGEVKAPHGNKGLVRAIFEKGLPGQAINTEVEIK